MPTQKPREIAVRVLQRHGQGVDFVENLLESELPALSGPDRGLCQELVFGIVRWQRTLDWLIAQKSGRRDQKPSLLILLRLGLYQLFWLDRVPDHAAVNETVELARQFGLGPQSGFINALLRGYTRERYATRTKIEHLKHSLPALGCSHPDWLCARWQQRWGPEKLRQLLDWNNAPPPTFARVNTLRTDAGSLLDQWRLEGVHHEAVRRDWFEDNLVFELKVHPPLASLPSFQQGGFYVQDPGTLLAVHELAPQPGDSILDLCAAPGGKTTRIAQLMRNRGRLVAREINPSRLHVLSGNCRRMGVVCAELLSHTGGSATEPAELADRVLVDVPCSNTGVLRRRLDARWRIRPEEIHRLRSTQSELLHLGALQTRPGGTLVYSTCSLEPEENSELVKDFVESHSAFELESERELLPFIDSVDGAYVARIRRRLPL